MKSSRPLRVLYTASECAPWIKTGGLADVTAALPPALAALGVDVRVCLPGYRAVRTAAGAAPVCAQILGTNVRETQLPSGIPVYLVDAPALFDREGGPYQDLDGRDWADNAQRFGTFAHVAAILASDQSPLSWRPHIFHGHDWQTALAPVWLTAGHPPAAASLMTIHNLAFQGLFPPAVADTIALPIGTYAVEGTEFYGQLSFLKGGLHYADALTTVSPTYAHEIQQAGHGWGLEGLLARRREDLIGIVNGIDDHIWDPATDPLIAARYTERNLHDKARNKSALQRHMGLPVDPAIPLLAVISRLSHQKGLDLVLAIADRLAALPAQLVVLGAGETAIEAAVRVLANDHPAHIAAHIGFDEGLAHLIEAGADMFLMPSRFEPCGLTQMYSQRYGTPPIAHATGGLVDTIIDERGAANNCQSGFLFQEPTANALWEAVCRALDVSRNRDAWKHIQRNGMRKNFSWSKSACEYLHLYERLALLRP
ncbi:MAG: glycogen synthase GlgA [Acidiferrobacter sp.]